ncbi:putative formin-like protein 5 [Iris pallida]|uniref:Formin-like protein 5 n=2 Tax=Iris pallida TaxID=29817 RepID=A0AAX6IFH9_IRIPA|nr:putative formin-like protein 5 [Iris pallida]
MSCRHHHSHNHHHSCCCHGCNTSCCSCHSSCSCNSSCSSQPPPISDLQNQHQHLLQTLLLLQQPLKPHHQTPANKDPQLHPSLLQSLLRRIANLETTAQRSPSPPRTPTQPPPPPPNRPTIKHLAATTIQTHFRRHLARRSRTLRDLNRLAAVKSRASALRSSLSEDSDPREASQIAMDLLSQLDSIQSRDPMIREGKRSITRELVRVTEFVDKVLLVGKGEESGAVGCGRRDTRVRFAENGNGCEAFDELSDRVLEAPEGEEGMAHTGGHGFYRLGDEMGLSAPLPVTMEPVRSGSKKKPSSS